MKQRNVWTILSMENNKNVIDPNEMVWSHGVDEYFQECEDENEGESLIMIERA